MFLLPYRPENKPLRVTVFCAYSRQQLFFQGISMRFALSTVAAAALFVVAPVLVGSAEAQERRSGTPVTIQPRTSTLAGTYPTRIEQLGFDYQRNRAIGNTAMDLPGYFGENRTGRGLTFQFFGPLGTKGPGER
jgi:hypothetical protein